VAAAITGLPSAERIALTLHYVEGLSDTDIARILDWTPGSVSVRRANAVQRLARFTAPQ
jgi:DNA-directed RNA polymerase specialized sigma24 family protein